MMGGKLGNEPIGSQRPDSAGPLADQSSARSAYASLYGPPACDLARGLGEVGEALATQMARLETAPDPDECERVARNLDGAARACMRLRERLLAEGASNVET
jgi:hypothetical protein